MRVFKHHDQSVRNYQVSMATAQLADSVTTALRLIIFRFEIHCAHKLQRTYTWYGCLFYSSLRLLRQQRHVSACGCCC